MGANTCSYQDGKLSVYVMLYIYTNKQANRQTDSQTQTERWTSACELMQKLLPHPPKLKVLFSFLCFLYCPIHPIEAALRKKKIIPRVFV
jgi:hypothetical protein